LSDYGRLLEKANAIDRKALIQLLVESIDIEDKKIKSINLAFDKTVQALIQGESSDEDDSLSFVEGYCFEYSIVV